jgi:hypothetical protein
MRAREGSPDGDHRCPDMQKCFLDQGVRRNLGAERLP